MKRWLWTITLLLLPALGQAQIYEPEGLNMPGTWNGWTNPPTNNLALASSTQVTNGRLSVLTSGTRRWQTIFSVDEEGADVVGGTYAWLFSSGSTENHYNNTWKNVIVSLNQVQSYSYNSGSDNSITVSNGKWYTMNWRDNGYENTDAIFMETSAEPVTFATISRDPSGTPNSTQTVTITVETSASPSAEERIYVYYSTDNFASVRKVVEFDFTDDTGTADIPAQANNTEVSYRILSSTVELEDDQSAAYYDMRSIRISSSSSYTVEDAAPLDAVTLVGPADEATNVLPNTVFEWETLEGADTYQIQISTVNTFDTTFLTASGLTETEYTATSNLGLGTEYFWRVRGVDENGNGPWSEVRSFTVLPATATYSGNGGLGFGGTTGSGTLRIAHANGRFYFELVNGTGTMGGNDNLVLYLDNNSGGRNVIGAQVNDQADQSRRAISSAGEFASTITFPHVFRTNRAIAIGTGFSGIFTIPAEGAIAANDLGFVTGVGNAPSASGATFRFSASYEHMGFDPETSNPSFRFNGILLNGVNGFTSNEGFGGGITNNGESFGAGAVSFTTYFHYPSGHIGGQNTSTADGVWSSSSTWANGNVPFIGDNITIGHEVTLDSGVDVLNITINEEGRLINSEFNILVLAGGSFTANGAYTRGTAHVRFQGNGALNGSVLMYDVLVSGGVAIDKDITIGNSLTIESGGYIAQTPGGAGVEEDEDLFEYGSDASLIFTGEFNMNNFASGWGTSSDTRPRNLIIENGASVTIEAIGRALGGSILVKEGGSFNTGGLLTLLSNAYVHPDSEGELTGSITFQREIEGAQGWRFIYPPASGRTYNQVLGGFWTQGIPGAQVSNGQANVLRFNEATNSYVAPANLNDAIGEGNGFVAFIYQKDDGPTGSGEFPKLMNTTGAEGTSYTKTLGYTADNGWHLLGNPFSSPIRAGQLGIESNAAINNNLFIWSHEANSYVGDWEMIDATDASTALIAPFQAFFVRVSEEVEFTLPAAARSASNFIFYREPVADGVTFTLAFSNVQQQFQLRFNDKANEGLDAYDAYQLKSLNANYVSLFGRQDGQSLAKSVVPTALTDYQIPLFINSTEVGTSTFTWEANWPEGISAELLDLVTNERIPLQESGEMNIDLVRTHTPDGKPIPDFGVIDPSESPRFMLIINPATVTSNEPGIQVPGKVALHQNYPNPFNPNTSITFELPTQSDIKLSVYDITGRLVEVISSGMKPAGTHTVAWHATRYASGMYIIRLETAGQVFVRKMTLLK